MSIFTPIPVNLLTQCEAQFDVTLGFGGLFKRLSKSKRFFYTS